MKLPRWRSPFRAVARAAGNGRRTLPPDAVPWDVSPVPRRVVAIGDLHGDLTALLSLLLKGDLIDDEGEWCGGSAQLVLAGDLVRGEPDSRLLIDFVLELERAAARDGGAVHALLGNHDLVALTEPRAFRGKERELYERFPVAGRVGDRARDAFRGRSVYAEWLRRRNAIVKIGDTLFAHAGIGEWIVEHEPGRVNASVRAWIRFHQGVGPEPDRRTRWVVGDPGRERGSSDAAGPLWTRAFKLHGTKQALAADAPTPEDIGRWLEQYGARRLVIGHAPTVDGEVLVEHPHYGEAVLMIDAGLAGRKRLSGVELGDRGVRALHARRSDAAKALRRRRRKQLEARLPARGFWEEFRRMFR